MSSNLHPVTALCMLACGFRASSSVRTVPALLLILFLWVALACIKGRAVRSLISIRALISTVPFMLIYLLLMSEEPYLIQTGFLKISRAAMHSSGLIWLRLFTLFALISTIINGCDRREWMSLFSRLGLGRILLSFGVGFNLLPLLQSIFREFYWELKSTNPGKVEVLKSVLHLPHVVIIYSLVHAEDIYKAACARGFDQGLPVIRTPLLPDRINLVLIIVTLSGVLFSIFL
ncbi:MAG: energy-coupling factor transporter transmembrane component T [Candidatus Wallbacteria bacterium]|nr:energy-coupling factor transporter transmembrane component T [Candidatus Wallbacteria bacterium]